MNSQSLNKLANKVLVIGGSTYNPCTPCRIRYALEYTNFLENWAVVFANHDYFHLSSQQHQNKIHHEFYNLPIILVEQLKTYSLNRGFIYVLPECTDFNIKQQNDGIEIDTVRADGSRLCINKVMKDFAINQPKIQVAGLIICGRFKDGAEGLKEIKDKGGITAVQKSDECYHPDIALYNNDTDSMPKSALKLCSHQEVSLEYPPRTTTLTEWLCTL